MRSVSAIASAGSTSSAHSVNLPCSSSRVNGTIRPAAIALVRRLHERPAVLEIDFDRAADLLEPLRLDLLVENRSRSAPSSAAPARSGRTHR